MIFALSGLVMVWVAFRMSDFAWSEWTFVAVWFSAAGVGGGVGSFLAWMSLEIESRRQIVITALLLLMAGLAGAWGAYYVTSVLPEDPDPFGDRAISSAALLWATLIPNAGATVYGILKEIKHGWI